VAARAHVAGAGSQAPSRASTTARW
jgi:hypothetical protein